MTSPIEDPGSTGGTDGLDGNLTIPSEHADSKRTRLERRCPDQARRYAPGAGSPPVLGTSQARAPRDEQGRGAPGVPETGDRRLLRDLPAIALLWALVVAFFWRIALAGRVLAGGDIFTYFYPYWAEATRATRAGRLPLWNPYLFLGAPFLANSQVGVFYPLNWPLWLLLPAHRSVHVTIVLHLCLAALTAYLWGRTSLRMGRVGAWTVGAVFALGGYLGAQVEHVNQLQGLAWLPLALMLWDQIGKSANRQISRAAFVGLACVVGLVLLAGHTQTAFISLVGLAAYGLGPALWRGWHSRKWKPAAQRAAWLAAAASLGGALAAVQLIPTGELSRLSMRARGLPFNERVSFSLSPLYLARALLPSYAEPVLPEHIEHVAYVGIAGLTLAIIGIRNTKHETRNTQYTHPNFLSVILLCSLGLFLSLGLYNPIYLLLARYVPGFAHFRVPARWLALTVTGAAGLAGWGADACWRRRQQVSGRGIIWITAALVVMTGWAALGPRIGDEGGVGWPTIAGWAVGIGLALGMLLARKRAPRLATAGLVALAVAELFAAGFTLPHSQATAPQAFTSLRPAIAHLFAADEAAGEPPARFISMSDITFDPGDLPEMRVIYGPQLAADALYDYVIAAKQKEVLSPNLPLAFGVPAVDGYDGGVLPLARYVTLQRVFLSEDEVSIDGRLRENLSTIPDGRWLNLFNVQHVITDKLHDAWLDDVFYDLQWGADLGRGEAAAVTHVPHFEATALGIVSHLRGGSALPDGARVGVVEIGLGEGLTRTFELRAGQHTAEGVYGPDAAHAQAAIGGHFRPPTSSAAEGVQPEGNDYVTRLRWGERAAPNTVTVRATLREGELVIRGVSLIDERTGGFQALVLSDRGNFRLAHSGDVKIYENLDVLPRSFLVHRKTEAADDERAVALMRAPAFDPAAEVILSTGESAAGTGDAGSEATGDRPPQGTKTAQVVHYAPEQVEIEVNAEAPGYVVLTDAWYPGWEATVDGELAPVYRADLFFRAVAVPAGNHQVVFTFRPRSVGIGVGISLAALAGLIVLAAGALSKAERGDIMCQGA